MRDIDKHSTLYYTVRSALALCTNLEILYLHTDPSVARIMLGACTFRLKIFSIVDPSEDLATVFLSHQESLQELVIVRGALTPLYLPKHALPNLTRFSGIPENVVRICQGRRLRTLRILPGPALLNLGDTLSKIDPLSISSLCEFHVLVTGSVLHHVTVIAQLLPSLSNIVIRYYQQEVLFGALGMVLSTFTNLREFTMLSLNVQAPMTAIALDSEYSLVMFHYEQCPTLHVIVLRSICWVYVKRDDQTYWSPQMDDLSVGKMWDDHVNERAVMSTRMAEDTLRLTERELSEDSSSDYVSIELDNMSEASDYGDEVAARRVQVEGTTSGM
ncbi:hypothetical protein K439DRAFT_1614419 [Ramaria rubella]|nr:hypothetical protein K439DRAFT_1614419 [Ramaria rubella]